MNSPAVIAPQPGQVAPVSAAPELSETLSQALYDLIAQQPFFKGLNPHQLQLLTDSALEMKFETEQTIFAEGSPANRFYLILEGKVMLESEMEERGEMIPIQTLGRAMTWAGPGFSRPIHSTSAHAHWSRPERYFFMGRVCGSSANKTTNWAIKS